MERLWECPTSPFAINSFGRREFRFSTDEIAVFELFILRVQVAFLQTQLANEQTHLAFPHTQLVFQESLTNICGLSGVGCPNKTSGDAESEVLAKEVDFEGSNIWTCAWHSRNCKKSVKWADYTLFFIPM